MSRVENLASWHADWSGIRAVVLGLGVSGFAAADTLAELGADVLVLAESADSDRHRILDVLNVKSVIAPVEQQMTAATTFAPDVVIVSPGFHPSHEVLQWAATQKTPVWVDVELAWRVRDKVNADAKWVLITGTNGKTTTTEMTAHMLATAGLRAAPCGNIGVPVLDAVRDPAGFDVYVVELSSFQLHYLPLEGPGALQPWSAVCLNLADDHLDWHGSLQAYAAAKAKIYNAVQMACVYNRADKLTELMVEEADVVEGARAISFGLDSPGRSELGMVDGVLCDRAFLDDRANSALELTTVEELGKRGLATPHVVANALAAAALARSLDVSPDDIHQALDSFVMAPHRVKTVAVASEITWVNDSKATNPAAANASLHAFESVVWVVGGLLKGVELDDLLTAHVRRLRAAVVIGVDRQPVLDLFARVAPDVQIVEVTHEADSDSRELMVRVVDAARTVAQPGDTVLLAPAAASMDQFRDYADRGEQFERAVRDRLGIADENS